MARTWCADSAAHRRVRPHVRVLRETPSYAVRAADDVVASLRSDFPAPVGELSLPRRVPAFE